MRDEAKELLNTNLEDLPEEVKDAFNEGTFTTLIFPIVLPNSCVLVGVDNGARMVIGAVFGDMSSDGDIIKDLMDDIAQVVVGSDLILGSGMMPDIRQANRWYF